MHRLVRAKVDRLAIISLMLLMSPAVAAAASLAGILKGAVGLKALAVLSHFAALVIGGVLVSRVGTRKQAVAIAFPLAVCTVFPLTRIAISVFENLQFKSITELLFIQGGYYQLPFVAIAYLVVSCGAARRVKVLRCYGIIMLPVGVVAVCFAMKAGGDSKHGIVSLATDNAFIPVSLLACNRKDLTSFLAGVLAIAALFIVGAMFAVRTYVICSVVLMLAIGCVSVLSGKGGWSLQEALVYIALPCLALCLATFAASSLGGQTEHKISEKWKTDSLIEVLATCKRKLSLMPLWEWEGNSRREILVDAFRDFDDVDWLFGRGLLANYQSFEDRKTIEMGVAQETFRWGAVHTTSFLVVICVALYRLSRRIGGNVWCEMMICVLSLNLVNLFVFGIPQVSVYHLLVFVALLAAWWPAEACDSRQEKLVKRRCVGAAE